MYRRGCSGHNASDVNGMIKRRPALVQSLLGYSSAGLGLICEAIIALRFGATAETDLFRWASLAPSYAISLVGAALIPVLFRDRIAGTNSRRFTILTMRAGALKLSPLIFRIQIALAIASLLILPFAFYLQAPTLLLAQSLVLSLALVVAAAAATPAFYAGLIWAYIALSTSINVFTICALMLPVSIRQVIAIELFLTTAFSLFIPTLFNRLLANEISALHLHSSESRGSRASVYAVVYSNAASMITTTVYYGTFSTISPGLLSLYAIVQKSGLLLSVPSAAVINRFLRDQRIAVTSESYISRIGSLTFPLLLLSPVFALASFGLVSMLYGLGPDSKAFSLVANACVSASCFSAVTTATGMLVVARASGLRAFAAPSAGLLAALIASLALSHLNFGSWTLGFPAILSGIVTGSAVAAFGATSVKERYQVALFVAVAVVLVGLTSWFTASSAFHAVVAAALKITALFGLRARTVPSIG